MSEWDSDGDEWYGEPPTPREVEELVRWGTGHLRATRLAALLFLVAAMCVVVGFVLANLALFLLGLMPFAVAAVFLVREVDLITT